MRKKHHRRHEVQLALLGPHIELPQWQSLPEASRREVVVLLMELLKQHVKARLGADARGGSDE